MKPGGRGDGGSRWVVKNIRQRAKYYFGGNVTWGPGEEAPEGTAFEKVGSTLKAMKKQLKPGSKDRSAGAFYGKDLAWWRSRTRDILHPSVLAFE